MNRDACIAALGGGVVGDIARIRGAFEVTAIQPLGRAILGELLAKPGDSLRGIPGFEAGDRVVGKNP